MKGNVLKITSIPKGNDWCDKEILMIHSCFQIFIDCVEKDKLFDNREYYFQRGIKDKEELLIASELQELKILYNWWKKIGSNMGSVEIRSEEANEKLIRLIKLKHNLWV